LTAKFPLDFPWSECFKTWDELLAYCVPQDRAMSAQPWRNRIVRQEIDLGIPLHSCLPLRGSVTSRAAQAIAGCATPLCFLVERVAFHLVRECSDVIVRR
jgi:hypothetical protein